jgi:hypothetical protein
MPPSSDHKPEMADPLEDTAVRRRKKQKVLGDAGLTDAQRRETRGDLRQLYHGIQQAESLETLKQLREINNEVFESNVKYTREAVLDAENVGLITDKYSLCVEKLVAVSTA